ncbi:MAG: PAS domain-containing protein [Bacteroidota bacterium]|nr:PAS domain-containing protein [Bacteroidota bacterium]
MEELNNHHDPFELLNLNRAEAEKARKFYQNSTNGDFIESRLLTKNRKVLVIKWARYLLPDGAGIDIGFDITKDKKERLALKNSEEKFRGLIERISGAIYRMKIPEGTYEFMSAAAENVFGYEAEEFLKNPLYIKNKIHPDYLEYFNEKFQKLLNGQIDPVYEYKTIDKNNETRWIRQSNKGIYNDKGELIALEGLCVNVTKEKNYEKQQLNKYKEINVYKNKLKNLNKLILETEENERQKIASYLHDSIGQLLSIGNMILTSIDYHSLDDEGRSAIREVSDLIKEAVSQTRMLTYELAPPMLNQSGLIDTLKWEAKNIIKKHGIEVKIDTKIKHLDISKNTSILMFRIISELILNVIKHAKASKIVIEIRKGCNYFQISVIDNGIGFNYDEYNQQNCQKNSFGLFSIKERMEAIQGEMNVESNVNIGTKVTIKLQTNKLKLYGNQSINSG